MDTYNRYLMRSSGERIHQAQGKAESVLFGVMDFISKNKMLSNNWETLNEITKNQVMEDLRDQIQRSMDNA